MKNSALAVAVIVCSTGVAVAQTCENGVCLLGPPSTRSISGQVQSPLPNTGRGDVSRQNLRAFGSVIRGETASANGRCRGLSCNGRSDCDCHNQLQIQNRYRGDSFQAPIPQRSYYESTLRTQTNSYTKALKSNRGRQLPTRADTSYRPVTYRAAPVEWHRDIRDAARVARQSGRPMLIKVSAKWCGHCQQMKQVTFADSRVIRDIRQHFVAVDLDADANRDIVKQLHITSLPTILVVSPELRILAREEGFRTAVQIGQLMHRHMQRAELDTGFRVVSR
ncbi:MAG: thioredoxin family protein [Fuerstiella sp.]